MHTILKQPGTIDISVQYAGAFPKGLRGQVPISEMAIEYWNAVVDLNLNGVFICAKAVSPTMARKQFGRTINVNALMPWKGNADLVAWRAVQPRVASTH